MLRTFFFAVGLSVSLWGGSLFFVDGIVTRVDEGARQSSLMQRIGRPTTDGRLFIDPPDWVGYTLVGMGGLTALYSIALPRK